MKNREIKFRGKRKGGTEWLIGDLNHINGQVFIMDRSENAPLNSPDWFEVDPETVGQFTGLKDKNGVEIYDGDFLELNRGIYLIQWDLVSWNPKVIKEDTVIMKKNYFPNWWQYNDESKVIGNIFTSPELLTNNEK